MDFLSSAFCGIFLNITGICLWGLALLYFIRSKDKGNCTSQRKNRKRETKPFDQEMFAQMVKQQSGKSFERIFETIRQERELLWAFIEHERLNTPKSLYFVPRSNNTQNKDSEKYNSKRLSKLEAGDKYPEAIKLADLGLTTKKISEKVNLPKGEIELLIKLRKKKQDVVGLKRAGWKR